MTPKALMVLLATLITLLGVYFSISTTSLPYSEAWLTEVEIIDNPKLGSPATSDGKAPELIRTLNSLQTNKALQTPWKADRRYKSSIVYIQTKNQQVANELYTLTQNNFNQPIIRTLPQRKINISYFVFQKIAAIAILYLFILTLILATNKYKTLVISITSLAAILGIKLYMKEHREWYNQIEYECRTPYTKSAQSYGHIHAITSIKSQVGELTTRILEGENKTASFKMKSAHRIYNQQGKKRDVQKIWIRSTADEKELTKAAHTAESLLREARALIKKEKTKTQGVGTKPQ
jgi:hypothetical protein